MSLTLNETLRLVMRECVEAYTGALEDDTKQTVHSLKNIKSDIEAFLKGWNGGDESIVDSRWLSNCPPGYDTIVGWLAKHKPEQLEDFSTHSTDGRAITKLCKLQGLEVKTVEAPLVYAYSEHIKTIHAYPVEILQEWFA